MKLDVCDCEILALDSGVITCPASQDEVPVAFLTIRITGQARPVVLGVRNPHRLTDDLPSVIAQSRVLSGDGKFVPESDGGDQ